MLVLRKTFVSCALRTVKLSFSSSKNNKSIPPPPNPTVSESFNYKLSKKDLEKFMNPTGFLEEKDFEEYEGVTKDGKIVPSADAVKEQKPNEKVEAAKEIPKEYGFKIKGPEPTRYGDWERKGRCSDF